VASSERKRKHRQMNELGWWWCAASNAWEYADAVYFYIIHDQAANKWVVDAVHPNPIFDCYLAAAVWVAVEVSNGQADRP